MTGACIAMSSQPGSVGTSQAHHARGTTGSTRAAIGVRGTSGPRKYRPTSARVRLEHEGRVHARDDDVRVPRLQIVEDPFLRGLVGAGVRGRAAGADALLDRSLPLSGRRAAPAFRAVRSPHRSVPGRAPTSKDAR